MKKVRLEENWILQGEKIQPIGVTVPGCVHTDLVANGLMPDLSACTACGKSDEEAPSFFFRLLEGDLICPDCITSFDKDFVRIRRDVIALCRRSIEVPEEKAYALKIPDGILRDFSRFTERYLLCQLERDYQTLNFYHQVKKLSLPVEEETKKENQENGEIL